MESEQSFRHEEKRKKTTVPFTLMSGLWALKRKEKKDRKEEGGDGNKEIFNQDRKGSRVYTKKPNSAVRNSAQ